MVGVLARPITKWVFDQISWLTVNQLIAYTMLIVVFRIRDSKEPELLNDSRQARSNNVKDNEIRYVQEQLCV